LFVVCGLLAFLPHGQIPGAPQSVNLVLSLLPSSPLVAVIGLFIMAAGNQELAMLRYQEHRRYAASGDVPTVLPVEESAHPSYPVQPGYAGFTWGAGAGAWMEGRNGQPVAATSVNQGGPSW